MAQRIKIVEEVEGISGFEQFTDIDIQASASAAFRAIAQPS